MQLNFSIGNRNMTNANNFTIFKILVIKKTRKINGEAIKKSKG